MGANVNYTISFLLNTLFTLAMGAFVIRAMLQWVRADFYNPISQLIWRLTRYPTDWVRRVLPRWRNLDTAAVAVLLVIALIYTYTMATFYGFPMSADKVVIYSLREIISLTANLYTYTLLMQALLSFLGPGVNNPAGSVLWSLNEPLLRPVRRLIPPISGLDLSPIPVMLLLQVIAHLSQPELFR